MSSDSNCYTHSPDWQKHCKTILSLDCHTHSKTVLPDWHKHSQPSHLSFPVPQLNPFIFRKSSGLLSRDDKFT